MVKVDYRYIYNKIIISNKEISNITKEASTEIAQIKRFSEKIKFEVKLKLIRGYPKITISFIQELFTHQIIAYNKEVNTIR